MDFVFAFGAFSPLLTRKLKESLVSVWGDANEIYDEQFYLCYPKCQPSHYLVHEREYIACIDGWAGTDNADEKKTLLEFYNSVRHQWPLLDSGSTGSFSGVLYDRKVNTLRIFCDLGGIFPFYYAVCKGYVTGGTSLIALGRALRPPMDVVGVIQRVSPPNCTNYGRRTILEDVYRLMPGEMRIYDAEMHVVITWDNALYGEIKDRELPKVARNLWEIIKADVEISVRQYKHVYVGMSGGWDSRLAGAALRESAKSLTCLTYGTSTDQYEVRIARECARILGADFVFCDVYSSYFPTREDFIRNLSRGEGTQNTAWFSVLSVAPQDAWEPIVLGDLFEVMEGRGIEALTSRKGRLESALGLRADTVACTKSTPENFEKWSGLIIDRTVDHITGRVLPFISPELMQEHDTKDIVEELITDLRITLNRIAGYLPPYAVLYDELFKWHTHRQNRQILCLKERYIPVGATMGFRVIRATASVDPAARASGRLRHEIQRLPSLRKLSALPAAHIPFVPSSFPLWLKNVVWGLRWFADQQMTKRAIKKGNPGRSLRVLKSLDLVKLYNHPEAIERVQSWFSGSILADYQMFLDLVRSRATLRSWPLINSDIVGPASTCLLIDLIYDGEHHLQSALKGPQM